MNTTFLTRSEFDWIYPSPPFTYGITPSPFGPMFVVSIEGRICTLHFVDDNLDALLSELCTEHPRGHFVRSDKAMCELTKGWFQGEKTMKAELMLIGTEFQHLVWQALLDLQMGEVMSYAELAAKMGRTSAVRAVASGVARNPVGLIVPCHRIMRSDGSVGEYHWGSERKAAILAWEQTARRGK